MSDPNAKERPVTALPDDAAGAGIGRSFTTVEEAVLEIIQGRKAPDRITIPGTRSVD
jgi:hypothetical protein